MVKECVGEAKALLEELKPEAGAATGGGLSRAGFLKALAGGLAALAVAAVGVEEASAGCPYTRCGNWSCSNCNHNCNLSGPYQECTRYCETCDPCAGYGCRSFTQKKCVYCGG